MTQLSRREFAALAGATFAAPLAANQKPSTRDVTAHEVADRIRMHIGVEWKPDSVDGFKAGQPSATARGIVTTSMATLDVLQQAVKAGSNLVVTSLPTFYSRTDARTPPAGRPPSDPMFAAKNDFIAKHEIVIFRLSEHWRLRTPNPLAQGMAEALGWMKYQRAADSSRFEVPELTLDTLAGTVNTRFQSAGGVRIVGDPRIRVRRVGLLPGTTPIQASVTMMPDVDVIIAGEVREWESVEYVRDKAFAGERKGLILVGRVVSEEPGMRACADWLKTLVPEVPVRHITAGDPYWRPLDVARGGRIR